MRVKEHIPLAQFNNYRIGGPARYFFDARNSDDLRRALRFARAEKLPFLVLGAGTNLLIDDKGFHGVVIRINIRGVRAKKTEIVAGAGVLVSDVLAVAVKKELTGFEWAGGLPGTIGGAVRGNAGCFGAETKDIVTSVNALEVASDALRTFTREQCGFGYRSSIFKENPGRFIIIGATLLLRKGKSHEIEKIMRQRIDYRNERHPMEYPNIGSIFKNVRVEDIPKKHLAIFAQRIKNDPFPIVPAAHFITRLGLKGVICGGAMISPKHGNFVVNVLDAKASDVSALIALMKNKVKKQFGITLEEEIQRIP